MTNLNVSHRLRSKYYKNKVKIKIFKENLHYKLLIFHLFLFSLKESRESSHGWFCVRCPKTKEVQQHYQFGLLGNHLLSYSNYNESVFSLTEVSVLSPLQTLNHFLGWIHSKRVFLNIFLSVEDLGYMYYYLLFYIYINLLWFRVNVYCLRIHRWDFSSL